MKTDIPIKDRSPICMNCHHALQSETASTGLRCGWAYFQQKPIERKAALMATYAEVPATHSCEKWRGSEKGS
ncbi:MAG: hypothetical protein RJA34_650 [Pseudomonadota bacterium]|jgi:tRNA(Ile2) C34 agmatinyltransferase TiaS